MSKRTRHPSHRAKARAKRNFRQQYEQEVANRIKENAEFLGVTVAEYCANETGEHDIW
jgi:hypothetical protein